VVAGDAQVLAEEGEVMGNDANGSGILPDILEDWSEAGAAREEVPTERAKGIAGAIKRDRGQGFRCKRKKGRAMVSAWRISAAC
jgi:hypothetical protein